MNTPPPNTLRMRQESWSDKEIFSREDDRFGFQDYAKVMASLALEAGTPLTIGIFGRWGSGKTSLMRLIQSELEHRKRLAVDPSGKRMAVETIWINVWQLSNQEALWNAFLQALLTGVHQKLGILRRLAFDLRLLWERVDLSVLLRQLLANTYRIVIVITPLLITNLYPNLLSDARQQLLVRLDPLIGGSASLILGLWLLLKPLIEAARDKVSLDLGKVLKEAPYEAQVSALQQLQGQFERMVRYWVGKRGRLVVFIDDLDRCPPDRVPDVLEALKLFTTTSGCVYVLGLDYGVVRQGIATKYEFDVSEGAEYLEKIIQIPFHLPPLEDTRIKDFVRKYYPDLQEQCVTAPEIFSSGLEPNPRKVKRALNIYRTLLELSTVRVNAWQMEPIDSELLAKMVVIQSRFHKLHDYLVQDPVFLVQLESNALDEKLKANQLADDLRFRLVEQVVEDDGKQGLVNLDDLPALEAMLCAGKMRFQAQLPSLESLLAYIYLIGSAKESAERVRPSREDRDVLLSNDHIAVETKVAEIIERGKDEAHRQRIIQSYLQRLESAVNNQANFEIRERRSANYAWVLFKIAEGSDELAAYLSALKRDEDDPFLHWKLADIYEKKGRFSEADREKWRACQIEPKNPRCRGVQAERRNVRSRRLSPLEVAEARRVFGEGLDYSRVRVVENATFLNGIGSLGARLKGQPQTYYSALTLGNTCYFPIQLKTSQESTSVNQEEADSWQIGWLVHELTHVWQYQQMGWRYLILSLQTQFRQGAKAYQYGGREALQAYQEAGKHLVDFNLEQQADIARDYYNAVYRGGDASTWEPFVEGFRQPATRG